MNGILYNIYLVTILLSVISLSLMMKKDVKKGQDISIGDLAISIIAFIPLVNIMPILHFIDTNGFFDIVVFKGHKDANN